MKKEFTGIFRGNSKGFGFVKLEDSDEEIYVSRGNTQKAIDGDTVLVKIIKNDRQSEHQEGRILKVLKHEKDTFVGIFQKSKNFGFVVPDDKKINTDIYVSKKNNLKAKNNQKVVVKITKYPQGNKSAEGKIIEIIGNVNQAGVDILSLVKEYNLPYEFPEDVVKEAENIKQQIAKKDIPNRLDLRNETIFTIDGEDAKDLDDAVIVKKLENGNYLLNVSIADVSYYVKDGSKIDKEAIIRGTSIYMLDRVIPMLPKELSNGICSLNENEERFAITVFMEIDKNGDVVSSDIKKSIIKVSKRMSYKGVQAVLDKLNNKKTEIYSKEEAKNILKEYKPYYPEIKIMEELAITLKNKRKIAGGLDLDIPETKITLNEDGVAINIDKYELYFANEIIEQFMLTANEVVAEKFYWLETPFIYRVHEEPEEEKIKELNKFLWNLGYKIKTSKDVIHPKSFADLLEQIKGKEEERVISNIVLRTLKNARYEPKNKGHFGIASKYYCHFTSPIRRYPDLFIHRVISEYLQTNYEPKQQIIEKFSEQSVKYSQISSEREKVAQKVERDAEDIKKAEFMQENVGKEYDGIISNITSFGIFVELANTVEGLIRFDDLGDEYFIFDENSKTLLGEKSKIRYKIGMSISIKVISADKLSRKIDFAKI